ncbi:hypothetical protein HDV01_001738 [Terramyces sp. JEL0728]|nr:hypothetical protein HDV01_001738 [Terramyces sp. JEL0728]
MNTPEIIKWLVFGITVGLQIISVYFVIQIGRGKVIAKIFRTMVLVMLFVTLVHTTINIKLLFNFVEYLQKISGVFALATVYLICLFNIQIIQVFAILNSSITPKKLFAWAIFVTVLFIVCVAAQVIGLFYIGPTPALLRKLNSYSSTGYTVFAILYDVGQGIYLVYLVSTNKKKKGAQAMKILQSLVLSMIGLAVMDCFGIVIYAAAVFIPSLNDIAATIVVFSETYTGIHAVSMIHIFKLLKDFTFIDTNTSVSKKQDLTAKATKKKKSMLGVSSQQVNKP